MNFLYINYPSWIHPELFPGIPALGLIRWYGLMYVFAIISAFIVFKKLFKEGMLEESGKTTTEDDLLSFISLGFVCLLLGARIFSTLIYNQYDPTNPNSINYWAKPWLIFWPFDSYGNFTGLAGMSYHGGVIGGAIGTLLWCTIHKRSFKVWTDTITIAIPFGYTFGRLGNFLNGELYGRITTKPWGMIFPDAEPFSASIQWVKDFAAEIGMSIPSHGVVNLPRHPSQLYEAFFEGIVLFLIMWLLRKRKHFPGFFVSVYLIGYGTFRFAIEYFRMPDSDIGFRISQSDNEMIFMNSSLLNISTGQILCFLMIIAGLTYGIINWLIYRKQKITKA